MIDNLMIADAYLVDRLTNNIICGYCNLAKNSEDHDLYCFLDEDLASGEVTYEDLANQYPDYYEDDTLILEESIVSADAITREDEWAGIYANRERDFIGRYDDVEPNRCTVAVKGWTRTHHWSYSEPHLPKPMKVRDKRTGNYNRVTFTSDASYEQDYEGLDFEDPRLMRLEFNELQGFVSSRLIDFGITERYAFRFFNIFVGDYDKKLHVGSCTVSRTVDNRIKANCKKCNASLVAPHADDITRDDMETFIHAIIRHGNNHGPEFITSREDFAYIHAENCDTLHAHNSACNANTPRVHSKDILDLTSLEENLDYLIEHRKVCTSSDCRCTHYYHLLNERTYANV